MYHFLPEPPLPPPLGCHRAPGWAPCAIWQLPTSLSVLHMIVYICQCYFLNSPLLPLLCPQVHSLRPYLHSFPANRSISTFYQLSSVQFSCSVVSDSLRPHESQHARPLCPSPTPGVHSNSCPSSWWCHPTISSSVIPFSHLQSFPASGSFPMSQFFALGGQSIGVSASALVFPVTIQGWKYHCHITP